MFNIQSTDVTTVGTAIEFDADDEGWEILSGVSVISTLAVTILSDHYTSALTNHGSVIGQGTRVMVAEDGDCEGRYNGNAAQDFPALVVGVEFDSGADSGDVGRLNIEHQCAPQRAEAGFAEYGCAVLPAIFAAPTGFPTAPTLPAMRLPGNHAP